MLCQFHFEGSFETFFEAIEQHYQITFIKTAKYPADIAALLYPYFIESIISSHMREKLCWNSLKNHNHIKYLINLAFHLFRKPIKKVIKIVLVENQCSFFLHVAKLTNNGTKKLIDDKKCVSGFPK